MNPHTPSSNPHPLNKNTQSSLSSGKKLNDNNGGNTAAGSFFKKITLFSAILTWPLISFGTYVRLKGAGLSCPDWPLCYGKIIPPEGFKIALEVGHRFLASFLGLSITVLLILSSYKPQYKSYRRFTIALFLLVVIQGILGGMTVLMKLSPPTVVFHLLGGNLLFSLLIYLSYSAYSDSRGQGPHQPDPPVLTWHSKMLGLMLIIIFVVIVSGGANSSTYSGYACSAFPGCQPGSLLSFHSGNMVGEGNFLPRFQNEWIHMIHRLTAIVGAFALAVLTWLVLFRRRDGAYRLHALAIWSLLSIEIILGILNAVFHIPVPISAAHTAVAATIVGLLSYSLAKSIHESH
ncbi:MAG: COX15/CtaA family protein [SAR324 cluster bacterium]|nr:COX15/CtaA family protein [SAR324 cluster bacterium]